jgi:hypothetical protein
MFKTFTQFVTQIIRAIENTGILVVRESNKKLDQLRDSLVDNTYTVHVDNPQTKVDVKGTVIVGNQAKLEKKIELVTKAVRDLNKVLPSLKEVTVKNQKDFPDFPKSFEVSNLASISKDTRITNINMIVDAVNDLNKKVSKLKLDPTIKVEAPKIPAPVVNVPKQSTPVVNVHEKEVDLSALNDLVEFWQSLTKNAKKSLSVRLSDGKKFYKALDELVEATANVPLPFQTLDGDSTRARVDRNHHLEVTTFDTWGLNNTEKLGDELNYFGRQNVEGEYIIMRIVDDGILQTIRYASIKNNSDVTNYTDAWDQRGTLNYGLVAEVF